MSKTIWDRYVGKNVFVQLRAQPFIGVTGQSSDGSPQPVQNSEGAVMNSPLLTGVVREALDGYLVLEHPDPIVLEGAPRNKVLTQLSCERDIGYISIVELGSRVVL